MTQTNYRAKITLLPDWLSFYSCDIRDKKKSNNEKRWKNNKIKKNVLGKMSHTWKEQNNGSGCWMHK